MSAHRFAKFIVVAAILLGACLACGGQSQEADPSLPTSQPIATNEPTAESQPTATTQTAVETQPSATAEPTAPLQPTVPPTTDLAPGEAALALVKATFAPNEEFQVQFTAPSSFPPEAWVGLIPSEVPHGDEDVNDQFDLAYWYLDGQTTGVLTFTAPMEPGSYDLRMHDTDDSGAEVASVTFLVEIPAGAGEPRLQLEQATFAPNDAIRVRFDAPAWYPEQAWVGLIPSEIPHGDEGVNDENDIEYWYLDGQTTGVLTFTAPMESGSYDLRLNDGGGQETASVTFGVAIPKGAGEPGLQLDKATYSPEEEIRVTFEAPSWYAEDAWVGILPSDVPHGDEDVNDGYDLSYEYLEGRTSGEMIFTAPLEPGSYDVRMHDTDDNGKEVASVTFEVK